MSLRNRLFWMELMVTQVINTLPKPCLESLLMKNMRNYPQQDFDMHLFSKQVAEIAAIILWFVGGQRFLDLITRIEVNCSRILAI